MRKSSVVLILSLLASGWSTPISVAAKQPPVIVQVSQGAEHTCVLSNEGSVQCWGHNSLGPVGDGTNSDRSAPVPVAGLSSGVRQISAGGYFTCALTSAGGVKCWGSGTTVRYGDVVSSPTPIDVPGWETGVAQVSAGYEHVCAVTTAGAAQCRGSNSNGQLGNGTAVNSFATPVEVIGLGSGVSSIHAYTKHTCAIVSNGAVMCWGANDGGILGTNEPYPEGKVCWFGCHSVPVVATQMQGGFPRSLATGRTGGCGLMADGLARCWGPLPARAPGTPTWFPQLVEPVKALSGGASAGCALTAAGEAKCWNLGQSAVRSPLTIADESGVPLRGLSDISVGEFDGCAVTANGGVRCWEWPLNASSNLTDQVRSTAVVGLGTAAAGGDSLRVGTRIKVAEVFEGLGIQPGSSPAASSKTARICRVSRGYVVPVRPGSCRLVLKWKDAKGKSASRQAVFVVTSR
jgi:hypothetical protein